MNDKLKQAIKLAKESLKNLDLDDLEKPVAFSKAIDYYLYGDSGKSEPASPKNKRTLKAGTPIEENHNNFWNNLARTTKLEENSIKDIYSLKNKTINLVLSKVRGADRKEQQVTFCSLILYGYIVGLDQEWVKATILAEAAKAFNLYDSNISKVLSKSPLFRKTGVGKGLEYKLTVPATSQVVDYLKELAK